MSLTSRAAGMALLAGLLALPDTALAQFRYPPPYPYRWAGPEGDLRIAVKPRDASVYVDGYFAGSVDDFDGVFQRLHLPPGEHEVVVHLAGYRSLRERVYVSPNSTRKIEGTLERQSPGEPPEPRPTPTMAPEPPGPPGPPPGPQARGPRPPRGPVPPVQQPPRRPPPSDQAQPSRFGTLSIRVQPPGADVLIDGERWTGPSTDDERLIVQVVEGRHRIGVRRDGFEPFDTEVDVRRGTTESLNVSLTRDR